MGIVGDLQRNLTLLRYAQSGTLSNSVKAMVAFQMVCILYIVVYILILVFWGDTYGLNESGKWMTRVAVGSLVLMSLVDWMLSKDKAVQQQYIVSERGF